RNPPRLLRERGLERAGHRAQELLQSDGLLEEVEGADLRGLDRGLDRAVARHHHDGHRELPGSRPLAQERDAVCIGHPDVEQDERRLLPRAKGACFGRVLGDGNTVALVLQDFGEEFADADFVVDDQDVVRWDHGGAYPTLSPALRGNTIVTRDPRGSRFASSTRPPCSWTILRTMARPRPVPFAFVVTLGSEARGRAMS